MDILENLNKLDFLGNMAPKLPPFSTQLGEKKEKKDSSPFLWRFFYKHFIKTCIHTRGDNTEKLFW